MRFNSADLRCGAAELARRAHLETLVGGLGEEAMAGVRADLALPRTGWQNDETWAVTEAAQAASTATFYTNPVAVGEL